MADDVRRRVTALRSLPELFGAAAPAPGATLLEVPGGPSLTYGAVQQQAARLAHALRRAGVGHGDRVAVQVEKRPELVALYLATLRAGAVYLPVNTAYTAGELDHLVADAQPSLVLEDHGFDRLLTDAAAEPTAFDEPMPGPGDLACLLYTSGTTGKPKGAPLTHANIVANVVALRDAWGYRPDDRLLHVLPMYHAHGLLVATNLVLATGSSMTYLDRFDLDVVLDELPRSSVFMGVPTHYARLLGDDRFDAERCRGVRLFVSGSAPLQATAHEAFTARTGHRVLERYGMSETMMLTSNPLDGDRRPGSVGLPLPGVEVRVSGGDPGAVEVRGPNVFAGYWRRPDLDGEFTDDGWFVTGDLGTFDPDGYLRLVGRSKDLVISGGLNVYPAEVEDALDHLEGIAESAVIGVPHDDLGEAVVAVVVPEPGATVDPEAVRAAARSRLAGFKVPKRVHVVDALPRNAMGKVEKTVLRRTYGALPFEAR